MDQRSRETEKTATAWHWGSANRVQGPSELWGTWVPGTSPRERVYQELQGVLGPQSYWKGFRKSSVPSEALKGHM